MVGMLAGGWAAAVGFVGPRERVPVVRAAARRFLHVIFMGRGRRKSEKDLLRSLYSRGASFLEPSD